ICDELSHVYNYEGGGIARNSGCSVKLIQSKDCQISVSDVESKINPPDAHYARTSLLCVEDTVNKGGGVCYEFDQLKALSVFSKEKNLAYHLDGARMVNALVAKGHDWKAYGSLFDSISICLSKGLGTPGGSVLLGSRAFIEEAHRVRKVMGGGMRQTGMLAAAGLHAMEHHVDRMVEDHQKARLLGECLTDQSWVESVVPVETNIVVFELKGISAGDFQQKLAENGILALPFGPAKMRFVTHLDFRDEDLAKTIKCIEGLAI
ncbi:MAG: threonine aldolase family protein, partial [Flavobacteriales bacterium]